MPTITYQCPNEECEADHEIEFSMHGKYLRATMSEPAEYPEPELDGEIITECDHCGHKLTDDERTDLEKIVWKRIDNYDHSKDDGSEYEPDDFDDRRSNFGMW